MNFFFKLSWNNIDQKYCIYNLDSLSSKSSGIGSVVHGVSHLPYIVRPFALVYSLVCFSSRDNILIEYFRPPTGSEKKSKNNFQNHAIFFYISGNEVWISRCDRFGQIQPRPAGRFVAAKMRDVFVAVFPMGQSRI